MKLFIDTADDVAQIREAVSWRIINGATTDPTHVAKTVAADVCREILEIVNGPVGLETLTLTAPRSSRKAGNSPSCIPTSSSRSRS